MIIKSGVSGNQKKSGDYITYMRDMIYYEYQDQIQITGFPVFGAHDGHLFGHYLLILKWNIVESSINFISFIINHAECRDDVLMFFIGQNGIKRVKKRKSRLFYSNPFKPFIFHGIALSQYLFSNLYFMIKGSRISPVS